MSTNDYIDEADRVLDEAADEPMPLDEFLNLVEENPQYASQAAKYLLEAIESMGTRTVIEEGEEKERYRFFDDPHNDGEHAVLGNTEMLNDFVDALRMQASECGTDGKIVWFDGPTATGKSELKRCLINGLRAYSRTEEGKRFTVEWNITNRSGDTAGLSYADAPSETEEDWYESPVNSNPLTVLPKEVRERLVADLNERSDGPTRLQVDCDLDPFCREAYDILEDHYKRKGVDDLFSAITAPDHLRVKRKPVSVGDGIGVLHSEDDGSPKERLVGSWMPSMLKELNSRGRKNPQAFSYDGVLAQGNSLLTVVEDASQHSDLLQKLLNIPDERQAKLDNKIKMDLDTVLVIISNPDLSAQLDQHADRIDKDPLKALKRRLNKYQFTYLTSLSAEAELIRRELTDENGVWDGEPTGRTAAPLHVFESELAPHSVEAAAMYSVVTRLDEGDLPDDLTLVDKALLFERGYHEDGDERIPKDEFDFDDDAPDGEAGIPVTYTRDMLADLLQEEDIVLPGEVLDEMVENLSDEPVFSDAEISSFETRVAAVDSYIADQQADDVIEALLRGKTVTEEEVADYIDQVHEWADADTDAADEDADFDPLKMKVFEVEHLGAFSEDDYTKNSMPKREVKQFRQENIIDALSSHAWQNRGEGFEPSDISFTEVPALESVITSHDWEAVAREYENLDPAQWRDPPSNTQTEAAREEAIENMVEMFDYTEESALRTSVRVMDRIEGDELWD